MMLSKIGASYSPKAPVAHRADGPCFMVQNSECLTAGTMEALRTATAAVKSGLLGRT